MSRGTAYYDLPNGERIELPPTMPDVEEVPGPLCDGKFELPEAVKEMFKWMDETFGTWESDFSSFKIWMKLRKNFNPPVRWEAVQDKRRNPKPLGRNTYLYKARKIKSLARSTHTRASLHKGMGAPQHERRNALFNPPRNKSGRPLPWPPRPALSCRAGLICGRIEDDPASDYPP